MFSKLSERITCSFVRRQTISEADSALYRYGVQQGLTMALNILTTVCIGWILGMVWQSLLWMIAYIPLRSFAGGYHSKTPLRCYGFSCILTTTALLAIRWIPWTTMLCVIVLICANGFLWYLAPVAATEKPLDATEQRVYRKRARVIGSLETGLTLLFWFVGWQMLARCLTVTLGFLSIMLLLGVICAATRGVANPHSASPDSDKSNGSEAGH